MASKIIYMKEVANSRKRKPVKEDPWASIDAMLNSRERLERLSEKREVYWKEQEDRRVEAERKLQEAEHKFLMAERLNRSCFAVSYVALAALLGIVLLLAQI